MAKKQKYYVVWKGKHPGIYETWKDCQDQINGYSSPLYKAFDSKEEAVLAYRDQPHKYINAKGKKDLSNLSKLGITPPETYSLCVDAACSGNPGVMEYRGVFTDTSTEVFKQGPFPNATVNIGEFLAVVHALAYLHKNKLKMPVYSDSKTAMAWVRNKQVKTKLTRNAQNEKLFELIKRALHWLNTHSIEVEIRKWDTKLWGEIPADFGRK